MENNNIIEFNNLTEEDNQLIESTLLGFVNESNKKEVEKIKKILSAMDKKIGENDKEIEKLLKYVEYFDVTNEKSIRMLLETFTSIGLALSVFGIEQIPKENKPLIGLGILGVTLFGFRQFYDLTNEKILRILYKKLGEIASQNGKLKGIYKDLDSKVNYYDGLEKGNYIVLS